MLDTHSRWHFGECPPQPRLLQFPDAAACCDFGSCPESHLETIMKPDYSKPVDVLAFLQHAFGACACSDVGEMLKPIIAVLNGTKGQHIEFDGVFYIVAGILTNWGLLEHGTSIRGSWLTVEGIQLMYTLDGPVEDIEDASGKAYDGLDYGAF